MSGSTQRNRTFCPAVDILAVCTFAAICAFLHILIVSMNNNVIVRNISNFNKLLGCETRFFTIHALQVHFEIPTLK